MPCPENLTVSIGSIHDIEPPVYRPADVMSFPHDGQTICSWLRVPFTLELISKPISASEDIHLWKHLLRSL